MTERHHGDLRVTRLGRRLPAWRSDVIDVLESWKPDAILLEHGASLDFSWTVLLTKRLRHVPKVLWSHGIERRELHSGRGSLASIGRSWQLQQCDAIVCYDEEMSVRIGALLPRKVTGFARNSTDGRPITARHAQLATEGIKQVRHRMRLSKPHYVLTLGRLVREKEFHRVIEVLVRLRADGLDVGVIIVGTGPEEERIRAMARSRNLRVGEEVVFAGAVVDATALADWLFCADVSVHPGGIGLAVVDCLFGGVPTITPVAGKRGPFHGPEWKSLQHDVTGWIVKENSDEAIAMKACEHFRRPEDLRRESRRACAEYAQTYLGIDRMVDGILDVLSRAQGHFQGLPKQQECQARD
jgi:glycosyltransferase involved in cell wall biosynthesis